MACEACSAKFSFFKRKKQCTECLRHFCSECVIKRLDKMLSCDSCCVLSQRPLVRSQIRRMRSRDLRQYLLAKKVCVQGCVEKEDLINLLMLFANGTNDRSSVGSDPNPGSENRSQEPTTSLPCSRSEGQPLVDDADSIDRRAESRTETYVENNIEIEEISGSDCSPNDGPEPSITEQDEISEASDVEQSKAFTEIPVWPSLVKLSDINELSDLEYLSVKQLKNLLSTNRVDYKGCIERCELLDRACRLWEEHKQSRLDIEKMDDGDLCKICWDAPIECVILECGHMACCINCGKQMSECPICKQYVVRVVRFFKA